MAKAELVFVTTPGAGHLVSTLQFARRLIERDARLSISILIPELPFGPPAPPKPSNPTDPAPLDAYEGSIRQVELPKLELPPPDLSKEPSIRTLEGYIEAHKPHIREFINSLVSPVAGIIVDMFCSSMIELANELSIPSYVFFTSGAAFLGFMLHLSTRQEDDGGVELTETGADLIIPTYRYPVPAKVIPVQIMNKVSLHAFLNHAFRFKRSKGIIVNSFADLEPYAVASLQADVDNPPVYPVGPLLDISGETRRTDPEQRDRILKWLDAQPESSVVFLCFGSGGSMGEAQMKEVAVGLLNSGVRFLWAARKRLAEGEVGKLRDYMAEELKQILPAEFLSATEEGERGILCGWAPQVEVLAHEAIGGFVSHCGWNSTLEGLWFGRPIVTWPMYAEQQMNAFELVEELGLAVELKVDYKRDRGDVVAAEELEKAIRQLVDGRGNDVRGRARRVAELGRKALVEGGSSFDSIGRLIRDFVGE